MPTPRVSVVLSVYNGERHLAPAITSILGQTFQNYELIVIDDGSTDGSPEIIRRYAGDPRVRVITQANRGLVAALNRGMSAARGELLARMDADDLSMPDRLERQVAFLDAHPEVALVGSCYRGIDGNDQPVVDFIYPGLHRDLWRRLFIDNPFPHGGTMMRRAVFERVGGYRDDYRLNEDYDLWRRLAMRARVANVPRILYLYRFNSNGMGSSNPALQATEARRIQRELWSEHRFPAWNPLEVLRAVLSLRDADAPLRRPLLGDLVHHQYRYAKVLLARGEPGRALGYLLGALLLDPLGVVRRVARIIRRPRRLASEGA